MSVDLSQMSLRARETPKHLARFLPGFPRYDNIVVRIIRICHEYQDVVSVMVVSSWNTQRVNRMMALCGSILTAA